MDIFKEQIIKIRQTPKDMALKLLIWAAAAMALAFVIMYMQLFIPIGAIGIFWGALFLSRKLNIEYEYILTNGDLDIDKITAKRDRRRILALKCADIEKIGKYKGEELHGKKFVCCNPGDNAYYIIAREKDEGVVCLVFAPDERMKEAIKKFVPRIIQRDAFSE